MTTELKDENGDKLKQERDRYEKGICKMTKKITPRAGVLRNLLEGNYSSLQNIFADTDDVLRDLIPGKNGI